MSPDLNVHPPSVSLLPEPKRLWVEALRSDRFRQTQGALTIVMQDGTERDCCLGVLCKVAIEAGLPVAVTMDESGRKLYDGKYDLPPASVVEWVYGKPVNSDSQFYVDYEYETEDGVPDTTHDSLAEVNDSHGADFGTISNLIDQQL